MLNRKVKTRNPQLLIAKTVLRNLKKLTEKYQNLEIEVINEDNFDLNSVDNKLNYGKIYPTDSELEFNPTTKHGIRISKNGIEKQSALILGFSGATGIYKNSYLIKNGILLICCSNEVYSLNLADLSLNWKSEFDIATCFGIYEFNEDFITHGELQVNRIDQNGNIKWTFGARDIFVNPDGKTEFKINGNKIELIDWQGYKYELNANGELLTEIKTA